MTGKCCLRIILSDNTVHQVMYASEDIARNIAVELTRGESGYRMGDVYYPPHTIKRIEVIDPNDS